MEDIEPDESPDNTTSGESFDFDDIDVNRYFY